MKEYVLKLSEEKFKELKFALNIAIDNRNTMIEAFNGEDRFKYLINEQKEYLAIDKELLKDVLKIYDTRG